MKRLTLTLGLVALAAVLAACSGATAAPATPAGPVDPGTPVVTARDLKFVETDVTVEADKAFDLVFDNQEAPPHNIQLSDAAGTKAFTGEIVSSSKVTYRIPALEAGAYTFICEVHPDMKGTLTAE